MEDSVAADGLTESDDTKYWPKYCYVEGVKVFAGVLLVIVVALWGFTGSHSQQSVSSDDATVWAQMTAVVQPTPSPTP